MAGLTQARPQPGGNRAPEKKKPDALARTQGKGEKRPGAQAQTPQQAPKKSVLPAYAQTKLAVSQPGDASEQEAEKVARQVAQTPRPERKNPPEAKQSLQRGSLEPAITPGKPEEKLAPAVVPAAKNIGTGSAPMAGDRPMDRRAALQREGATPESREASEGAENRIEARKGRGEALPDSVRTDLEARLGRDFSAVSIHTDPEAAALCQEHQARAFTVGSDIYFATGEYQPGTDTGRELLAHELTHVTQQGGGAARAIMRDNKASGGGAEADSLAGKGTLEGHTLSIPRLELPSKPGMADALKGKLKGGAFELPTPKARGDQIAVWEKFVLGKSAPKVQDLATQDTNKTGPGPAGMNDKIKAGKLNLPAKSGLTSRYVLRHTKLQNSYLMGTMAELQKQLSRPFWNKAGNYCQFQVDHILELQLGGEPAAPDNLQLLEARRNMSSGGLTQHALESTIRAAIPPIPKESGKPLPDELAKAIPPKPKKAKEKDAPGPETPNPGAPPAGTPPAAKGETKEKNPFTEAMENLRKKQYTIRFERVDFKPMTTGTDDCWSLGDIQGGTHLAYLQPADEKDKARLSTMDAIRIFPKPGGGTLYETPLATEATGPQNIPAGPWTKRMRVLGGTFDPATGGGNVNVTLTKHKGEKDLVAYQEQGCSLRLERSVEGLPSHLVPGQVQEAFQNAVWCPKASPIHMDHLDLGEDGDLSGTGRLTIQGIPVLAGASVDVSLAGGDLVFSKTFSMDEFALKGPIQLDSCSLTLSAGGMAGLGASGQVDFHIGQLAKGTVLGFADAHGDFGMGGKLVFDPALFTGTGEVAYSKTGGLKASGTLTLKAGALRGVQQATFKLAYDDSAQSIAFEGDAQLTVPGFKGAKLAAKADAAGNIALGGEAQLSDSIPRIKQGTLRVSATKQGDTWSFGGGGELVPDLDGLDASARLALDYQNGLLKGTLNAGYQRSIFSGDMTLNAKATVGPGGEDKEPLKVWGDGKVEVQLTPWLKARVGLTVPEEGDLTIAGELGLPSAVQVFPRKEISQPIFNLAAQIPIIPGVVAEVGGNLSATAGFGPGMLEELKLGIEYTPANEDATRIYGGAQFRVPADAGLRLAARAGVGLGVTGLSATGGLEIGGGMGLSAAATAAAKIDWSKAKGMTVDAKFSLTAEPTFTFDISGYISVRVATFSVYDWRKPIKGVSFGSGMRLGVHFPIHYEQGKAFKISTDDVRFERPEIDPEALMGKIKAKVLGEG